MRSLHDRGITHRSLTASHLLRDDNGKVWLLPGRARSRPATSPNALTSRNCCAPCPCSPIRTGPWRPGQRVLGPLRLAKALGVLQPIALSSETRRAIRKPGKDLLVQLRDLLLEMSPTPTRNRSRLERLRPGCC